MVTFTNIGNYGRLGNQLFQYAALRALSLHKGVDCILPPLEGAYWHGQPCLLNNFNLKCKYNSDFRWVKYMYKEPPGVEFDANFFDLPNNINIYGFFQNCKYFDRYDRQIIDELTPNDFLQNQALKFLDKYRKMYSDYEFVSIHLRRGDLISEPSNIEMGNYIYGNDYTIDPNSVWFRYFEKCKEIFKNKKVKYLLFSGGNRNGDDVSDILWLKHNFRTEEYIIVESNDPLLDFTIISNCDHNIMGYTSTFSWWSAYINKNPNKIITIPQNYFLGKESVEKFISERFTII